MEWKEYKVSDIAVFSQGKQVAVEKQYLEKTHKSIRFIRIIDYTSNWTESERFVDVDPKFIVSKEDIIMIRYGSQTCGKVFRGHEGIIANNMFKIKFDNKIVSNDFAYWFFQQPKVYNSLISSQSSSTMPALTFGILKNIQMSIPNIENQKRITSILNSLDTKIENNNKINSNLEAQAAALFKSWFVDFEPFRDGEFVESELGMIPKGWKVGTYEDIIEGTVSGDWGKDTRQGNYTHEVACIRGCDFQDMSNGVRGKTPQRYILEKNYLSKRLIDKDILVEISGGTQTVSTGRVCLVSDQMLQKYNYDIVCTNFCRVVRPLVGFSAYIYYSWLYKYNNKVMFGYENGTSGIKNFQMKDFLSKEPVLIPSFDYLVIFQKTIDTIQNAIQSNGTENTKLSTLRDTLLPKLMSGEIEL